MITKSTKKIIRNYASQNKFKSLREYLRFLQVGTEDGWLKTSNREYRALRYMIRNIEIFEKEELNE